MGYGVNDGVNIKLSHITKELEYEKGHSLVMFNRDGMRQKSISPQNITRK